MALSQTLPSGSNIKFQVIGSKTSLEAVVVGLCRGGAVTVKDLLGQGTEALLNLSKLEWSPGKSDKPAPKESAKNTVGGWLLDRKGKEIVVGLPGKESTIRGKLTEVFEDPDLGACFHLQVGEITTVYQWSNLLFVRRRVSTTPSNKPSTDKPAAAPLPTNDAEFEFEVDPSASMIGAKSGGGDELGLAPESVEQKPK